jgi:Zn-dependent protease with chaperone function
MLTKLINLVLIFIVCCCNFLFVLSPFLAILVPFIEYNGKEFYIATVIVVAVLKIFSMAIFLICFLMILYLFLDYIFGFSVRSSLKNCFRYEKYKEYDFLTAVLSQVKEKFAENSVRLYINKTNEINAFAVGSLGSKNIVISKGLIEHFLLLYPEPKSFLSAIRSVMAHEMSHLINKDFLPAYIILINQKFTNFVSFILHFIFINLSRFLSMMPYGGRSFANMIYNSYIFLNYFITFFNRIIVFNLYEFLRKFLSRSIEYRCDYQASQAFGGKYLASALSMIGGNGYFTIFSTHPSTKSRIKRVEEVKKTDVVIKQSIFDAIANYLAFMFLIFTTLSLAKFAKIDIFIREILQNHENIYRKLSYLWQLISKIY